MFDGVEMLTNVTVAELFRPRNERLANYFDPALVLGGSILIALCAQVAVWLPFSPVPVTGQTFAVLVVGVLLGARRGSLAVLMYIAEGAMGLPVFASGRVGPAILVGPTGGYLVGFVVAAYITGLLAESGWDRRIGTAVLAMMFGNVAIYVFGLLWLGVLFGFSEDILVMGFYPFVIGEVVKIMLGATVLPLAWKMLEQTGLGSR